MNYRRRDSDPLLEGSFLTLDSEAQETVRSLWERGGKWSLEKQGEVLADLHGGQGLAGLLMSRVAARAKFTVGISIIIKCPTRSRNRRTRRQVFTEGQAMCCLLCLHYLLLGDIMMMMTPFCRWKNRVSGQKNWSKVIVPKPETPLCVVGV